MKRLALEAAHYARLCKQARRPEQDPAGRGGMSLVAFGRGYYPESTPVPLPVHPGEGGKEP
jgi:hypothetical protein